MSRGIVLLIIAEFCFAAATVFVKLSTTGTNIPAIEASFFRYIVGFVVTSYAIYKSDTSIIPNNKKFVIWRALLNTAALIFFFLSIKQTSLTNANMLNMTYPAFIFLFAPFIMKEKTTLTQGFYLFITMIGVYMIIQPNFLNFNMGDLYGLLSGIIGGLAIMTLRMAREHDSTTLILFYLMAIGTIINGLILVPFWVTPNWVQFFELLASALLGFGGQAFLTSGYKHVEASKGSLVSGSRMIFAVLFGVIVFSESITLQWVIGGILITTSLLGISIQSKKKIPIIEN